ncbi:two-component system sensor histidine kinase YesM [Kineothrix alysoides]|uniref:Two-component system sensor histidine kinase YesM n=1 Tax=Kineothrix alysoides TaxID=1469948 RepID=A0A4R1R6X6_9FIRM|nr:histidine kinase [Kineothrix alysoides]TCL61062.1 two-component system sensor histidine kinase YesM [Kineothrix alysoides]
MEKFLRRFESFMDDFEIRKKLFILYIVCVILPLIVTDGFIIYFVVHSEQTERQHDMENIANAVQYNFTNSINNASGVARNIYMNKYINDFLGKEYENPLDYVTSYQEYFKSVLFDSGFGSDNIIVKMYSDNQTIVRGGKFGGLDEIIDSEWYQQLQLSETDKTIMFLYDKSKVPMVEAKRKIIFAQKMNFYNGDSFEKVLTVEIDYSSLVRNLVKMNYNMPVFVCNDKQILLSNEDYNSVGKNYQEFKFENRVGYRQDMSLYGMDFQIYILKPEMTMVSQMMNNMPLLIISLIVANIILPLVLVRGFNRSFTVRISELSDVFQKIDDERLVQIYDVRGQDEIGELMRNYNKMVNRINSLIETVYVGRMKEQEMMVARQNAELLALHSQINPHFLFNALESIRMHSIIKMEYETADMVERLAIMQRQYLEWGNDLVAIYQEMDFVKAYLELQKYRFGEKLSYSLEMEDSCRAYKIPKLTLVTFVENACVHGIESKSKPGWIFVRVFEKDETLCLEIEDTGHGMEEAQMKDLRMKMDYASIEMLQNKGRVGTVNACLRLKMHTNNQVRFHVEGEKGMGMVVQMYIPLKYV